MLTLSDALKKGKLDEFIQQQESKGIGPVDHNAFNEAARTESQHRAWTGS